MLIKILTLEPHWIEAPHGWMTGALTYASGVPEDEKHVGLYTDGSNVMRFEIQRNRIMQETTRSVLRISPFEVKVFDARRHGEEIWQETWGRYMDGINPVWVRESANLNYKFKIDKHLMPVNHAAFFRKAFHDFRVLHESEQGASAETATTSQFLQFMHLMNIDLRRVVGRLKNPDAALIPPMVNFCHQLNDFRDHGPINISQARSLARELMLIWAFATQSDVTTGTRMEAETGLINLNERIATRLERAYPLPRAGSI